VLWLVDAEHTRYQLAVVFQGGWRILTITQGVELLLRGRIVYDTSHGLPRNAVIKEVVDWMDKYWGTTR
jgi:hypothetical protein